MADQRRAPERAGRNFLEYSFAGDRFYLIDDVVAAPKAIELLGAHGRALLGVAAKSPGLDGDSVHAGDVNDRNTDLARFGEKFLNMR